MNKNNHQAADSGESLVAAADRALCEAKRAGGNCVRAFGRGQGTETRQ